MARIPMKDDPPSLEKLVAMHGDPIDALAKMHFDCMSQADQLDAAGELPEARVARKMADECRHNMAKYGFVPGFVDGMPKALRSKTSQN